MEGDVVEFVNRS